MANATSMNTKIVTLPNIFTYIFIMNFCFTKKDTDDIISIWSMCMDLHCSRIGLIEMDSLYLLQVVHLVCLNCDPFIAIVQ